MGDVILRYITPGQPPTAQLLGGVDQQDCSSTIADLPKTSPTADGYCTQAAEAADNPGYDPDASPARPLLKVEAEVGPSC